MDYNLLSQLLRELILDNDRVSLPGMGSFIADIAPAYFSEDGKTINPPFRRIFFRSTELWNDELIEKYYAEKLGVERDTIKAETEEFFEKFRLDLNVKKNIELPGFGKMRSTREGNIYFVAERGLDIYANAYGLEPISLKILTSDDRSGKKKKKVAQEMEGDNVVSEEELSDIVETMTTEDPAEEQQYIEEFKKKEEEGKLTKKALEEEVIKIEGQEANNPEDQKDIEPQTPPITPDSPLVEFSIDEDTISDTDPTITPEPEPIPNPEPTPTPVVEPVVPIVPTPKKADKKPSSTDKATKKHDSGKGWLIFACIFAAVVLLTIIGYVLLSTGLLDSLLYSSEELQLINGSNLQ